MAEAGASDDERTLPATQRRLEQAREEGQVPRSRALASALIFAAAATIAVASGPWVTRSFTDILHRGLTFDHAAAHTDGAIGARLAELTFGGLMVALPLCLAFAAAGVLAALLLGGWNFTTIALEPKWSRIDPLAGIGRMFSVTGLTELGKTLAEVALITGAASIYVYSSFDRFAGLLAPSAHGPLGATAELVVMGFVLMVVTVALTAVIDVPLQIWRHGRGLRMSVDEVKRESRESDGDPQVKARIRSAQREMARKRMMQEVPKADVVITNPTHYAVALKYDAEGGGAPRVVAKGTNLVAERIRAIAGESAVPIVEVPPLARALYAHGDLGREIPQALYAAVAQVLAFVFQLRASGTPSAGAYNLDGVALPTGFDPLEGHVELVAR